MYLLIKLFSRIPFPILYVISDFLYLIIYRIGSYRKKVVRSNLKRAFPGKTDEERVLIERGFYRNFCDFMVETIKAVSIDKKSLEERVVFTNLNEVNATINEGRSVLFLATHQFNWELMMLSASLQFPIDIYYIYHPLHHKGSDNLMLKLRGRFGANPVKRREFGRHVIKHRSLKRGYALVADQLPPIQDKKVWVNFLNLETAFFQAIDQTARLVNGPVMFFNIIKEKRGYYKVSMEKITSNPEADPEGYIIKKYAEGLQENINAQPEGWLWSHKRWKRKRNKKTEKILL